MKASDLLKKKGKADDKKGAASSKLIDWIGQRRGKAKYDKKAEDK